MTSASAARGKPLFLAARRLRAGFSDSCRSSVFLEKLPASARGQKPSVELNGPLLSPVAGSRKHFATANDLQEVNHSVTIE